MMEPSPQSQQLASERGWITIDQSALVHNIQQIQAKLITGTELMAIVKADAYGHGAVQVAKAALSQGVSALGVATIPEGIELRQSGITVPILVLGATHLEAEIEAIARWRLQPTICSPEQALQFSQRLVRPLQVHLNIDTGMSRLGPIWQQGESFISFVQGLSNLEIAGVYSHLATADEQDSDFMETQLSRFTQLRHRLSCIGLGEVKYHFANSAGMLSGPAYHFDLVRTGLALYGLYPAPQLYRSIRLRPVMSVKAKVTHVKRLPPETGISYGHSFITDDSTLVATIGIGYADGVPRGLSNRMQVLIHGQRAKQVGNVTMDQFMVNVNHIPNVNVGDVVTLIGRDGNQRITADDWATTLNTISYEIVCGFNQRLPRLYI
ncbi:MAG: alanine racemase [Cyanobacteria bacterium P01_F01_bin.42]